MSIYFSYSKIIRRKKIEIGLIGKPPFQKHLDFFSLGEIQDTFVASQNYIYNLKLREFITDKTLLSKADLMLLDEENITRQYLDSYLKKQGIESNHILEIDNLDLLIEFARIGLGAACVIKEFIEEDLEQKKLVELPLPAPIPKREIGFSYLNTISHSDACHSFIQFYKTINL